MKTKRQIFLVWSCDAWCSKDSMRLMLATTSERRLRTFISARIRDDTFSYDDENNGKRRQVEEFNFDWNTGLRDMINGRLHYGMYEYVYDGEEL